jgi:hypothetical protein
MKTSWLLLSTVILLFSACTPSQNAIETAIAQTQAAQSPVQAVTPELSSVETPIPTNTPTLTPASVPIDEGEFGTAMCTDFKDKIAEIILRWDDAVELASNTPRIALSDRIAQLQEIRRDALQLEEPLCGERLVVKHKLLDVMDDGIDFFTAFMADRDTSVAAAFLFIKETLLHDAILALEQEESDLPDRIHYYASSWETGFSLEYTDQSGNDVKIPTDRDRIGYSDMPAVFSVILSDLDEITFRPIFTIRLFNPTYSDKEMRCYIFLNGEVVQEAVGVREVMCSFAP